MFVVFRKVEKQRKYTDVKYNGVSLFPTIGNVVKQDSLSANFSITCWIKPEVDIAMTEEQELGDMRARFLLFILWKESDGMEKDIVPWVVSRSEWSRCL